MPTANGWSALPILVEMALMLLLQPVSDAWGMSGAHARNRVTKANKANNGGKPFHLINATGTQKRVW